MRSTRHPLGSSSGGAGRALHCGATVGFVEVVGGLAARRSENCTRVRVLGMAGGRWWENHWGCRALRRLGVVCSVGVYQRGLCRSSMLHYTLGIDCTNCRMDLLFTPDVFTNGKVDVLQLFAGAVGLQSAPVECKTPLTVMQQIIPSNAPSLHKTPDGKHQ